jgi:hypothetical protein
MKKLINIIRNDLAKKDPIFKDIYKEYSEKKRSLTHFSTEIEESSMIISEIKGLFQKCLNSSFNEYKDLIELILVDAEAIQNQFQALAQNFNFFLFSKLLEFLRLRYKDNKIDVENTLINITEEYQEKLATCFTMAENIVRLILKFIYNN